MIYLILGVSWDFFLNIGIKWVLKSKHNDWTSIYPKIKLTSINEKEIETNQYFLLEKQIIKRFNIVSEMDLKSKNNNHFCR